MRLRAGSNNAHTLSEISCLLCMALRQLVAYSISCARYNMIGPRGPSWSERWRTTAIQGTGRAVG